MANHGYAVCGGGGFGILSDFSAILITGNVGAFVRSDCVDRVYLAIIGKVGMYFIQSFQVHSSSKQTQSL